MTSFACRYEGGDDVAQVIAGESGNAQVRLHAPFFGNVVVQRRIDAFQHTGNAKFRVAGNVELREPVDGRLPQLRAYFLQPQDYIQKAAVLQTEGAPAGAQAPEIQETAILLVTPGKRLGIVAFFKTAREVRPAIKIVFFGHVFADERNAQSFDNSHSCR